MKTILFTQCVQNDFVKPVGKYDSLPNLLHVCYEESTRLMGINPEEGPVARFMKWVYNQKEDGLDVIHIRDWHDANAEDQKEHLNQFGSHCIMNTPGADFAFPTDNNRKVEIVNSKGLNDFIDTQLDEVLQKYKGQKIRVALIGVWTEAKITYLAYDLTSRFPEYELAICSALTASSSVASHYSAIEQLKKLLNVKVYDSIGEFTKFISYDSSTIALPTGNTSSEYPELVFKGDANAGDIDRSIIKYLFRGSKHVEMKVLDGGYSGNIVLGTQSVDLEGRKEVAHVVKIGDQEEMGKERQSFEKIEQVLGNNAPRVTDFIDYGNRGGIKYRYASMGKGSSRSFQGS